MGYAYTSNFSIPPIHLQKYNPPGRVHDNQSFFQNGFVQYLDISPEMRLMSVKHSHKVKAGDTLTSISQRYGISIQAIKDANSGINWAGERKGGQIFAGEKLTLPKESDKNWNPPMAPDAIGFVDLCYNLTLDQFPNAPNGLNCFGTGLTFASTSLTGYGVYRQYQNGGMSNVSPFQAAGFAVGATELSSKILSWFGFGTKLAPVIGRFSGIAGIGISSIEQWFNIYKSMDDLRFAPSYIDGNGEPHYGDPIPENIYWGGE